MPNKRISQLPLVVTFPDIPLIAVDSVADGTKSMPLLDILPKPTVRVLLPPNKPNIANLSPAIGSLGYRIQPDYCVFLDGSILLNTGFAGTTVLYTDVLPAELQTSDVKFLSCTLRKSTGEVEAGYVTINGTSLSIVATNGNFNNVTTSIFISGVYTAE